MFTIESLREFQDHMEWADAEVWFAVSNTPRAAGDESIRKKLAHVNGTQRAYLRMWTDQPQQPLHPSDSESLKAVLSWARPYYREARAYLKAADSSTLGAPVPEAFRQRLEQELGPGSVEITLGQTIFDVMNHATHHRGQINSRLRELDGLPPLVDYVAWAWLGRPAADWSRS